MNIFVGNLAQSIGAEELRKIFSSFGSVVNVTVTTDAAVGHYGNVYLVPDDAARRAILELDLTSLKGRQLRVRECALRERPERRASAGPWSGFERRRYQDRRLVAAAPAGYPTTRATVQ